jgi:hypothetical protein
MSGYKRAIIAIILTYIITRMGYGLFKFYPNQNGMILDFAIWVLTYSLVYWVIGRFAKPVKH